MGLKKERLLGLEGIKVLGQRRGLGSSVVNNRREDEIEEDIAVFGAQRIPETERERERDGIVIVFDYHYLAVMRT